MSKAMRIENIIIGLLIILGSILLILSPDYGHLIVLAILAIGLLVKGVGMIIYYFTMARHMVGGLMLLFYGIVFLDLGLFACGLTDVPKLYIMIYLMIGLIFSGAIDILKAFESKSIEAPSWKNSLIHGVICIVLPIISLLLTNSEGILIFAYAISIFCTGVSRIATSFKRTAVAYIGQ